MPLKSFLISLEAAFFVVQSVAKRQGVKTTMQQISDLVNMAKADALDAMGENRAALELTERYLGV